MIKKGLIVYVSLTGNTEKIALTFKKVFEEKGWECDCIKITKDSKQINLESYNLICVGSPIIGGSPPKEINNIWISHTTEGHPPRDLSWRQDTSKYGKGIAFVTYTGSRRGPAEALPSLSLIELQMEDKGYRCIGKLACPAKITHALPVEPNDKAMRDWHWNQQSRPHDRDLKKAETFLAEILEDYFLPTEAPPDSQYICIA
jgi:hypothetical protein